MGKQRYHRIEELLKCKGDYFMTFNSFNFLEKEEIVKDFISAYQELAKNAKMNYKLREIITLYRNISRLCTLEEIINMFNKEFPYLFNCYKV